MRVRVAPDEVAARAEVADFSGRQKPAASHETRRHEKVSAPASTFQRIGGGAGARAAVVKREEGPCLPRTAIERGDRGRLRRRPPRDRVEMAPERCRIELVERRIRTRKAA